ncbi:MAG: hypothetical protein HY421_02200 [Candidatus Kerfeldbacteria bacterium]|nr:hypothetical protein [Candidatus Kerfeldbacteria bacterium]
MTYQDFFTDLIRKRCPTLAEEKARQYAAEFSGIVLLRFLDQELSQSDEALKREAEAELEKGRILEAYQVVTESLGEEELRTRLQKIATPLLEDYVRSILVG